MTARVNGGPCLVDGCAKRAFSRGWCKTHYHRWSRHGDPLYIRPIEERRNWKGGRTHSGNGYTMVLLKPGDENYVVPGSRGYALEHRLVMGRHLGRPLRTDENVHHINGVKTDNRIENLELWVSGQPAGQRVEDVLAWALEVVDRYQEEPWL